MTKGTRSISPAALAVGRIITVCPDPMAAEARQTGEWTVKRNPIEYGEFVRLDVTDPRDKASVWLVHTDHAVTVQLTRGEEQARAAGVIHGLADDDLPEIFRWEIEDGEVKASLASGLRTGQSERDGMEAWRKRLGADEVTVREGVPYTRLSVRAVVDGVPVEVWTSIYDITPAKKTEVSA